MTYPPGQYTHVSLDMDTDITVFRGAVRVGNDLGDCRLSSVFPESLRRLASALSAAAEKLEREQARVAS
jgi:hypothetical protein